MGKILRAFVVIILLFAAVSLTLAILLFNKREMLKGRAGELEQGLIKISLMIESEPPEVPDDPAEYPARDISDCTDEILDNPQKSEFWKTYKQQLESLDQEVLDIKSRERELMSYYKIDPATSKPELNPLTGAKITTGPGTTQGVVDDIIARAEAQYNLLTETRQQLEDIRVELVDTINELNGKKVTLREKMKEIVDLNNKIMEINRTVNNLRNQIAEQQETIQSLEGDVANLQQEKRKLEEDNEGLELAKKELKATVRRLHDRIDVIDATDGSGRGAATGGGTSVITVNIPPGVKGRIAEVDQDHQFVVMALEQKFIDELRNVTSDHRLPLVSLIVQRGEGRFISKIILKQLDDKDKLGIGEILIDWQQEPIEVGDQILYQ